MYDDLKSALAAPGAWLYSAWVIFLIKYRKTTLGPLWIMIGPAMFILVLGELFRNVAANSNDMFVPHLAAGLVFWNYVSSIVTTAPRLYVHNRPALLHGAVNHFNIILKVICSALIVLAHQLVIVIGVMILHRVAPTASLILLIPAAALALVHSVWVLIVLGILGARYRDLAEVVEMMMRIAFLATPIIWMVGDHGRGSVVGLYLALNPFYHVIEPLRGAIIGTPISPWSWVVSTAIAIIGVALATTMYRRFRHLVVLWT
ncbi:MAG: ABC transporter permease [Hyphomicrobium sp.]